MERNVEIKKELSELINEKEILLKKLDYNKKRLTELCDVVNKSAIFDETIVMYIAQLISYKEDRETFLPFIYQKKSMFFGINIGQPYVCIAPCDNIIEFMRNVDDNPDAFFQSKLGYRIFKKGTVAVEENTRDISVSYYSYNNNPKYREKIIFEFLLDDYNIKNIYPVSVFPPSLCNFEDFDYVQDYIKYLFNLQIKNYGKQLSSDEMKKSLNDYLEIDKEKNRVLTPSK